MVDQTAKASGLADDEGIGLPELLVSMIVFSVVVAAVIAVFVNTIDSVRFVATKTATTADARIAMEAMSRSMRVAVVPDGYDSAILEAKTDRVIFFSSLARGPGQSAERATKVMYAYDDATRCVEETQVIATDNTDASTLDEIPYVWVDPLLEPDHATVTTKCLIEANAAPTFDYFDDGRITYDHDDNPATERIEVAKLDTPAESLPGDKRDEVVSIQVFLNVQDPDALDVNGTLAVDRVTLANVQSTLASGG